MRTFLVLGLLLAGTAPAMAAEAPRHVLVLNSFGPRFAPFAAFAAPFRQDLVRGSPVPLAVSELTLGAAEGAGSPGDRATLDYLHALFAAAPPELMVAIGGPATRFAQEHRAGLFPQTPLLLAATEARQIDRAALTDRDVAATHTIDLPGLLATILAVQPGTRRVFVVLGASPLERLWRGLAEKAFAPYADRIAFEWTTDLAFDAILDRVAALPPDAAVIYGLMLEDAAGVPFEEGEALAAVTRASAAPVYGIYDSQLGHGIVGGRLLPVSAMAAEASGAALRLLAGEPARDIAVAPTGLGPPTFDSRELVRFGIAEDQLPPGSIVLFREPTMWARHRGAILAALALLLAQSALIAWLYASRRRLALARAALAASEARLREAAGEARDFAGRLIRAQEDERARLGRELHDDITQRLAVLAIDVGRCAQAGGDGGATALSGVREELARLGGDVHALAYRLHPSILAELGLVVALEAEAERVTRIEGLPVEVATGTLPELLPQPLALCLYRVTQEALRNAVRHARARRVRLTLAGEKDRVRLTLEDDGGGFDPDAVRRKPSLGLASMRQRVAAAGGKVRIDACPGRGTRIEVELPLGGTGDDPAAAAAR